MFHWSFNPLTAIVAYFMHCQGSYYEKYFLHLSSKNFEKMRRVVVHRENKIRPEFHLLVHYATSAMKRFLTSVSLQHEPKASDVITLVKKTFFARVSYEILYHEVWNKNIFYLGVRIKKPNFWKVIFLTYLDTVKYRAVEENYFCQERGLTIKRLR